MKKLITKEIYLTAFSHVGMSIKRSKMLTIGVLLLIAGGPILIYGMSLKVPEWVYKNSWGSTSISIQVHLEVDSSILQDDFEFNDCRLRIQSFNTSGKLTTIIVNCSSYGTILNRTRVAGNEIPGILFPEGEPMGLGVLSFVVSAKYEGENATVVFIASGQTILHSDYTIEHILPGYYELQAVGLILISIGVITTIGSLAKEWSAKEK